MMSTRLGRVVVGRSTKYKIQLEFRPLAMHVIVNFSWASSKSSRSRVNQESTLEVGADRAAARCESR